MNNEWWKDESRGPKLNEGDTLIFSEHGRILNNINYKSHWFKLVQSKYGDISLLVEHWGGSERISEYCFRKTVDGLKMLDSDNRYLMLHALYSAYTEGHRKATRETAAYYQNAFLEGRLKSRKCKRFTKFWIEPKLEAGA